MEDTIVFAAGRFGIGEKQLSMSPQYWASIGRDSGRPGVWPLLNCSITATSSPSSDQGCLPDNTYNWVRIDTNERYPIELPGGQCTQRSKYHFRLSGIQPLRSTRRVLVRSIAERLVDLSTS